MSLEAREFEALVNSLQRDKNSFEKLYNYYYPKIVLRVKARYGEKDFAQDVAQEFFLRLLRKPPAGVTNPTAYVMKAADNIAYDNYKRQKPDADIEEIHNVAAKEECYTDQEEIKEILALLSDEERAVITLKIYGGYKFREIAQEREIKESTVRSLYARALKKCEKLYKEREK